MNVANEAGRRRRRVGPDLVLPAEAFWRLVFGGLDPEHTPALTGDDAVFDTVRSVFPGP